MVKNAPIDDECEIDILALHGAKGNYDQDLYVIGNNLSNLDPNSSSNYETQLKSNTTINNNSTGGVNRSSSFSNVVNMLRKSYSKLFIL
jgi:hypothetical protein